MAKNKEMKTRKMLFNVAVAVAIKYRHGYKGYEDEPKTLKAMRRRCPGFSRIQYLDAWKKGKTLYGIVSSIIGEQDYSDDKEYSELCLKEKRSKEEWRIIDVKRNERIKAAAKILDLRYKDICSLFLRSTRLNAVNWVYYWMVER